MNRMDILRNGITITSGDRNASYSDPSINLRCAGELKAVLDNYFGKYREISPAEREAIDLVVTKLGRIATGPVVKEDTYIDGAVYFAIAGEAATLAEDQRASEAAEAAIMRGE